MPAEEVIGLCALCTCCSGLVALLVWSYASSDLVERLGLETPLAPNASGYYELVSDEVDCCSAAELIVYVLSLAVSACPAVAALTIQQDDSESVWALVGIVSWVPPAIISAWCTIKCYRSDVSMENEFAVAIGIAAVVGLGGCLNVSTREEANAARNEYCTKIGKKGHRLRTKLVAQVVFALWFLLAVASMSSGYSFLHSDCVNQRWELEPEPEPEPAETPVELSTEFIYLRYRDNQTAGHLDDPGCCSGTEPIVYGFMMIGMFGKCSRSLCVFFRGSKQRLHSHLPLRRDLLPGRHRK